MNRKSRTIFIGDQQLHFETGKLARQANGAMTLSVGETILFASACRDNSSSEDKNFLPLKVDYQERFSSFGKTLGGFIKREGKPSERETLISRLIDRPIRPMFDENYSNETQILVYVFSFDKIHSPDPLAICVASAALLFSDIPFFKPVAAVRVGYIDQQFIVNPTVEQMKISKLDLIVAGTEDAILMIEGYCFFLTEAELLSATKEGHLAIQKICKELSLWHREEGGSKIANLPKKVPSELFSSVDSLIKEELKIACRIKEKKLRNSALEKAQSKVIEAFTSSGQYSSAMISTAFKKTCAYHMRQMIMEERVRFDGRTLEQIRPISIEINPLPRAHGSALFTRGETQALAVCTLGGESMAQRYEDLLDGDNWRRFYLQYFFPPFSVGETGRIGAPGRREIGHGKLAERGLLPSLPSQENFPYVIRLESTILESNGSSSMATVCGATIALMGAGVPIQRPIAGIAMGLILEGENFSILSDILGDEDALGDMDFKVTGDRSTVTAFQLDIKVEGITLDIIELALAQAREGRVKIIEEMIKVSPRSQTTLSKHAPRIETMQVKTSKIGLVIGPGGKQIRTIIKDSGAEIDINDNGTITISSNNLESIQKAKDAIQNIVAEIEIGKTYLGQISSIVPFGLFVKIYEKEGLCHISEYDHRMINDLHEVCKEGDSIEVKVLDINERGQIKLSRKALIAKKTN